MINKLVILICLTIIISCGVGKNYINLPYEYNHDNWFNPTLFDCIDCKDKYTDFAKDFFENDRIVFQPYSDKFLSDKELISKTHNTLIDFGYKKVIPQDFYDNNIKGFVDSLIYWKSNNLDTNNYYYKFWQRRYNQGTYDLTDKIIHDLIDIYDKGIIIKTNNEDINDTLYKSLDYDYKMVNGLIENPNKFYPDLFNFLNSTGQYVAAYQILYKPIDFDSIGIDKTDLIIKLPLDTVKQNNYNTFRIGYFDNKNNWSDTWMKYSEMTGP